MKSASAQNEEVPDGMHETGFLRFIKYDADGIEQSSDEQENKAVKCD